VARTIVQEADVILALGTRLGFNTTLYGHQVIPKSARIVQVDIDADAIGKYYPVHQGIVGDATRFARCLADSIELDAKSTRENSVQRTQELQRRRDSLWAERSQSAQKITSLLTPEQIFSDLRAVLPREVIVTLDSGTLCRQAADQLQYFCPPALLTPLDFGLVGFGYSAGLGAKVAAPHRPVVSLSGDGGFGMTMIEICTAVQSKINTVGIVLDNECWGSEKAYQRDFYDRRYIGDSLVNPRYDHVAQSCGATGFFVSERGQLADAVSQGFKASEPVVIHIKVDPEATVSSRKDALKHRGVEEKGH
jgi:acetolactate synthase-1/2/3 large subunit/sulfoacetaldehyde acetyltransferase